MNSFRPAFFALGAMTLFTASGCRTAGLRDLARPGAAAAPRVTETAAELLAEHNRNAARLESLEADPAITVNRRGRVDGKLAFVRERNFKLVLRGPLGSTEVADIGSNDQEFWFWVKDSGDRPAVYYCNYDDSGASPLATSLQPDWIVEALGLRVIPESETADMKVSAGKDPGTLLLTYRSRLPSGQSIVKETVLSEESHRIREHRISSSDNKALLARAVIVDYQEVAPAEAGDKVVIPKRIRLDWTQEKLSLDVSLYKPRVNSTIDEARRKLLFVEPEIRGLERRNLAELAGNTGPFVAPAGEPPETPGSDAGSSLRQSMPAPPPRVRLEEPASIGMRGQAQRRDDAPEVVASAYPIPIRGVEEVVGAPIPRISDPPPSFIQANSGWKASVGPALER